MDIKTLQLAELESAAGLLHHVYERATETHGVTSPWPDVAAARAYLERCRARAGERVLLAEEGGAAVGIGVVRWRGESATLGPIASLIEGRGIGGALLEGLLSRAEDEGAAAQRVCVEAWNASAYALFAGCGFGVIDTVAEIERPPAPGPTLEISRGLEVRAAEAGDLDGVMRLDHKLTGHERSADLASLVQLVARRRGDVVAYLGMQSVEDAILLGPAVAVDASDLFTLLAHALGPSLATATGGAAEATLRARLSTNAPAAAMAALGVGFRVRSLGVVMSRGAPPPARPPQLYSLAPALL
ncbi:MAG: hypothetical protein Tsb0020_31080 [Haliangiales bacterium]